mmetsp:Transcript_72096/g.127062  ORF Transcript_72096/g.127062 Transcript_72096/m.127062 type:complete len:191 (-) Transcript_72096:1696-2268(-)
MGQLFSGFCSREPPPTPREPRHEPVEKKGVWMAFVGACLLGLIGILELERQNLESAAIITEQATALAKQQCVLQSVQGHVHSVSRGAHRPLITLVKTVGSRVLHYVGCYSLGRWIFMGSRQPKADGPVNYKPMPASMNSSACAICLTNAKDTVLLPCRHFCLCWECSHELQRRCPICRRQVRSRFFLFNT